MRDGSSGRFCGIIPVLFLCFCCLHTLMEHLLVNRKELSGFSLNHNTDTLAVQRLSVNSLTVTGDIGCGGGQGRSCCLVRHMHAHTLTHRCSLFSQAAINLHARGYESVEGIKRKTESQKGLFKVNRGEQASFSGPIYWTGSRPQLSHAWVGQVMGQGDGVKGEEGGSLTPVTHENVNWLVATRNRSAGGHWNGQQLTILWTFVSHYRVIND